MKNLYKTIVLSAILASASFVATEGSAAVAAPVPTPSRPTLPLPAPLTPIIVPVRPQWSRFECRVPFSIAPILFLQRAGATSYVNSVLNAILTNPSFRDSSSQLSNQVYRNNSYYFDLTANLSVAQVQDTILADIARMGPAPFGVIVGTVTCRPYTD